MAFNTSYSAEKRFLVNPKDLRFTQPDIKSTFTDPIHPTVRDTVSLLRRGQLNPDEFGDLHVSIDQQGNLWCDNNRRLFSLREAGFNSVPVVFDGTRCPTNSLKSKLSDPDFMPRIRGVASRVQIPPPPTYGQNAYQMQKEASLPDWKRQVYSSHQDHEVDYKGEEELEARFAQLGINPSSSNPTLGVQIPLPPTSGRNAYQMEKETSLLGSVSAGYSKRQLYNSHQDHEVHFHSKYSYKEKVELEFEYEYPVPYEEEGKVWYEYQFPYEDEGYVEGEVEYEYPFPYEDEGNVEGEVEYEYPFPYEDGGNVEGEVEYEYAVPFEANGYPFPYEDEGEVEYEYPVPCEANGYPFPYENEGMEGEVECEYPVAYEGNGYQFPCEEDNYPVPFEAEDNVVCISTAFCEGDFSCNGYRFPGEEDYPAPYEDEDTVMYVPTVFTEEDFAYCQSPYHYDKD